MLLSNRWNETLVIKPDLIEEVGWKRHHGLATGARLQDIGWMDAEAHPVPTVAAQLGRAEALCDRHGVRLTELRRQVLALILEADRPVGAYELLDRLRAQRRGAAPPTVYRALEFLMEHGLIHKVERLSAFVGCPVHDHHDHAAQFLICGGCGLVRELEDAPVRQALEQAASKLGFVIKGVTVEAEGVCSACASTTRT